MIPNWADLLKVRLRLDDPQTIGDLAESMQAPRRAIEKAVEELRRRGEPIITGPWGVCLTRDPAVLRDNYRRLRSRYIHQAQGARELLRTARRFERFQQTELFG
jgi:biotin operon repressor